MTRIPRPILPTVLLLSSLAAAVAADPTGAGAPEGAPPVLVETLENGLTVVIQEHHASPVVALRCYVKSGSMTEGEFLGCGISHYYEHLLSGGTTTNRTEAEATAIDERLGGQSNAYTTGDHTCYYITTAASNFDTALDLYADFLMHCALAPEEVEREKNVILMEMNKGETEPSRQLYYLFNQTMFRKHLTRIPTIGYRENFLRLTRDDLVRYYQDRYQPAETVISIAGDIDAAETLEKVRAAFADWERRPTLEVPFPDEPPQTGMRRAEKEMGVRVAYLMMGYHTIDLFDEDLYPLDLLDNVLGGGESSRLWRKLRDEEGLVYRISTSSYTPHTGAGRFTITAILPPEQIETVIRRVQEEIALVAAEGVTDEELARAKRRKWADTVRVRQEVDDIASGNAADLMHTGDVHFSLRYARRIQEPTAAEVQAMAGKYFDADNLTVAVIRPEGSGEAAAASAAADRPGEIRMRTLDNGVRVLVRNNPGSGMVTVAGYFLAGSRHEPEGINGVSEFTARMMRAGTAGRSRARIAEEVDRLGASLSVESGSNTIGVVFSGLAGDLEEGVDLFADVLLHPAFPEAEIEPVRAQILGDLEQQKDDWTGRLIRGVRRHWFDGHPYGRNPTGDPETVAGLSREDLLAFHRTMLDPRNLVVAVFGEIDSDAAAELVAAKLEGLPPAAEEPPTAGELDGSPAAEDRHIREPYGMNHVSIGMAFPGVPAGHPDRAALDCIDAITSGVSLPGGWLHYALRGERDLVYVVHLGPFSGLDVGMIYLYTQATTENRDEVVAVLQEQIERIRRGAFTAEELATAKSTCLTVDAIRNQTIDRQATAAALDALYGLGYDHGERYPERIESVTLDDLERCAKTYFSPALLFEMVPESGQENGGE